MPVTAPPAALMLAKVSLKAPLVRAIELLLDRVTVTVEVPPDGIEAGLKALAMVGDTTTASRAVLLVVPDAVV